LARKDSSLIFAQFPPKPSYNTASNELRAQSNADIQQFALKAAVSSSCHFESVNIVLAKKYDFNRYGSFIYICTATGF